MYPGPDCPDAPDTLTQLYTLRSFVRDLEKAELQEHHLVLAVELSALAWQVSDLITRLESRNQPISRNQ